MAALISRNRLTRQLAAGLTSIFLALLGFSLLQPRTPVHAYNTFGYQWRNASTGFYADDSSSVTVPQWMVANVSQAAENWTDTPTPIEVAEYNNGSGQYGAYWSAFSDANSTTAGQGVCTYEESFSNGDPTLCDQGIVQFNFCSDSNNGACLGDQQGRRYPLYVAAHEMGHVLGLAHSCDKNALMSGTSCDNAPYSCPAENNCITTPQQDDINGINDEYGQAPDTGAGCAQTAGSATLHDPTGIKPSPSVPIRSPLANPITGAPGGPVGWVKGQQLTTVPSVPKIQAGQTGKLQVSSGEETMFWWINNWAQGPILIEKTIGKVVNVQVGGASTASAC